MRRSVPFLFTVASLVVLAGFGGGLSADADADTPATVAPSVGAPAADAPAADAPAAEASGSGALLAQASPPPSEPPPLLNLQIFPKDTPRSEVIQTMRQFCFALGVRCEHCHVEEKPDGTQDFASDENPNKDKARAMIRMANRINQELLATIPDRHDPPIGVTCYTCHHGLPYPETLVDRLRDTGSPDSAVAELRQLRETADLGRFDVSERGVLESARTLAAAGHSMQALAVLAENAAIHPESNATHMTIAEIHAANGDTVQAIQTLKVVLTKDPENRRARQMMERWSQR